MNKEQLLDILEMRFEENMHRHKHMSWENVSERISSQENILRTIINMEETGGQPDVMELSDGRIVYVDFCGKFSEDRVSLCYDEAALEARKKNKPRSSAMGEIKKIGADMIDEYIYLQMRSIEDIDIRQSVWIKAPDEIRLLGGALFGDVSYGRIFIYHNGAQSYYKSRGYRSYIVI